MVIPKIDIEAMCDYIEADLEMGVQMNSSDWRESLARVREWLGAVEQCLQRTLPNVSDQPSWCDDGLDDAVIGSLP